MMLKNQSPIKWDNPTFDYKQEVTKKLMLPIAA
jgi:transposase